MKYLFQLIVLICIVHGLVIHGSPLFKGKLLKSTILIMTHNILIIYYIYALLTARSINLTKRCTFGGDKRDCGIGDNCRSGFDCNDGLSCLLEACSQQTSQTCTSGFDCNGGLSCLEGFCTKTSKG
ncbi:hypothetical protein F8M41_019590 [Gigaspora margarita]|uniref:Uncharacterized protein n=1 Tax=Gigaspora margarita TaxID=4874 RepID=A0A8H4B2B2_GIGMA|nr:hypothetical protein F8M41_019590 [Gigaspora margarita]